MVTWQPLPDAPEEELTANGKPENRETLREVIRENRESSFGRQPPSLTRSNTRTLVADQSPSGFAALASLPSAAFGWLTSGGGGAKSSLPRTSVQLVHELEWSKARSTKKSHARLVVFPVERWKLAFDFCVLLSTLYSIAVIPFRLGFDAPAAGNLFTLETVMSLLLLVDIVLNFNTAFLEGRFWVVDRHLIARHYVTWPRASKSSLWLDVPGAIPVEVLEMAVSGGLLTLEPSTLHALRVAQLMRTVRFFFIDWRVFLQIRRFDIHKYSKLMSGLVGGMARMIIVMLYWVHLLGCGFFHISWRNRGSASGSERRGWVEEFEDGYFALATTSTFDRYIVSVYWSMGMVTGLEIDVAPGNQHERLYVIFANVIAAMVLAYVIAGVTDALAAARTQAPPVEDVKEFARWHELPFTLSRRVTEYAEYFWSERPLGTQAEATVLANLRPALRHAVFQHILSKSVDRFRLLSRFDGARSTQGMYFKEQIYLQLMPCVFEKGEVIVAQGDPSEVIYFLRLDSGHNSARVDARLNFIDTPEVVNQTKINQSNSANQSKKESRLNRYGKHGSIDDRKTRLSVRVFASQTSTVVQSFASHFASAFRYFGEESLARRRCPVDYVAETRVEAYALSVSALKRCSEQAFKRKPTIVTELEREVLHSILLKMKLRHAQLEDFILSMDAHAYGDIVDPSSLYFAAKFQRAFRVAEVRHLLDSLDNEHPEALPINRRRSVPINNALLDGADGNQVASQMIPSSLKALASQQQQGGSPKGKRRASLLAVPNRQSERSPSLILDEDMLTRLGEEAMRPVNRRMSSEATGFEAQSEMHALMQRQEQRVEGLEQTMGEITGTLRELKESLSVLHSTPRSLVARKGRFSVTGTP